MIDATYFGMSDIVLILFLCVVFGAVYAWVMWYINI